MSMIRLARANGAALILAVFDGQLRIAAEGTAVTFIARAPVDESNILDYQGGSPECVLRVGRASVLITADESRIIREALPCIALDTPAIAERVS